MSKEKKELTDMQKAFLEALGSTETGGNIRLAMRKAGYSDNTRPSEVLSSLDEHIREAAKQFLSQNSFKAAHSLIRVLDHPDEAGTANRLKAAEALLNRAGVAKEDVSLKVPESGIVIMPAKLAKDADAESETLHVEDTESKE